MIRINDVRAYNFMSYEELVYEFRSGIHSIVGRNGSGKSAIYESILYCFFGETAREAESVLRDGQKNVKVSVSGSRDDFDFVATRENGRLGFTVNGKEQTSTKDIKSESQRLFNEFIGADYSSFMQCMLFGHNSFRFARETREAKRREILEEFIDTETIERATEISRERLREVSNSALELRTEMSVLEREIEEELESSEKETKQEINENLDSITKSKKLLAKLEKKMTRESNLSDAYHELNILERQLSSAENRMREIQNSIDSWDKISECPTCGQDIDNKTKSKILRSFRSEQTKLVSERVRLAANVDDVKVEISVLEDIARAESDIYDCENQIKALQQSKPSNRSSSMKKKVESAKKKLELVQKKVDILSFISKSWPTIRNVMLMDVVSELNEECIEVSEKTNGNEAVILFDTMREKKTGGLVGKFDVTCLINGKERDRKSLSNGESQKVDIVVMLAMRNMRSRRLGIDVDTLFFDEVTEGLDIDAATTLSRYIRTEYVDRKTYILSHTPFNQKNVDSVVSVLKDGDVSTVSCI